MPKRGIQPTTAIPQHMRSQLGRASSVSRKANVTSQKVEREDDGMDLDEEEAVEDDDGEDDNMVEMLTILQELQKRKATKSSARSAAFQREKAALFSAARKRTEDAVRDGIASLDTARATVADLKSKEESQDVTLKRLQALWDGHNECVQGILGQLTGVIEDLSHRRATQIDESSAMLEAQASAREASRRKLFSLANARISESMENQKIATDATALIKHYQALLKS
ncbi:hypothetical protein C8Q76DRAFT_681482 [Earliella scabrosa]|nr:hypothetical protein C8Q76DRAFT_681482 [Earliella scabrosa]